ncbi:MAG TPA: preprotein translocase subunit SecE [Alphaproteobacteria bacterium]|jgi:preprotein translocase subunit SecE|nr:preprotein translocase subunit SecE [Alphaproteobacteria bacterium]
MKQILNFIQEVKLEVSKVVWPKRQDVIRLTLIVFLVSGILGGYVGGLDFLFTKALALIVVR